MSMVNFRADAELERDLSLLVERLGAPKSDVIRQAVREKAARLRRERLRAETAAVRDDPAELAELARVREDMADARAW